MGSGILLKLLGVFRRSLEPLCDRADVAHVSYHIAANLGSSAQHHLRELANCVDAARHVESFMF